MSNKKPIYIKDAKVVDTVIIIDHPQQVGFISKSLIKNCELIIAVPARGIIISNSTLENCHIVAKRKQVNHQWFSNSFIKCKFSGKFHGCEFGSRIKWEMDDNEGSIEDCNFVDTELHYCSVSNSVLSSNIFPTLPHFLILSPSECDESYRFPKGKYWEKRKKILIERDGVNAHIYNWDSFGIGPNMSIVFIEVRFEKTVKIGLRDLFLGVKWGI